jgi:hypothetical protein
MVSDFDLGPRSGEAPEEFEEWLQGHEHLVQTKGWSPRARGFFWMSGTGCGATSPDLRQSVSHSNALYSVCVGRTPSIQPIASVAALTWNAYRAVRVAKSFHPATLALGLAAVRSQWYPTKSVQTPWILMYHLCFRTL